MEECDDGNLINGDGCNQYCQLEICGNNRQDTGEILMKENNAMIQILIMVMDVMINANMKYVGMVQKIIMVWKNVMTEI